MAQQSRNPTRQLTLPPNKSAGHSFKDLLETLSYVVVVLGVPAFFWQQAEQASAKKVESTLEYIRLFQSERIASARERLVTSWFLYSDQIKKVNVEGISSRVLDHWVASLVDKSVEESPKENLRQALLVLNDFFNQLDVCVTSGACDEVSARAYFQNEAAQIHGLYGGWFETNRDALSLPQFGEGLADFALKPTPTAP